MRFLRAFTQSPEGKLWMPLDFSQLETETAEQEQVGASAESLLKTLFDEVEANKNNPVALQAFVDRGRAATAKLATAVATYTPAA